MQAAGTQLNNQSRVSKCPKNRHLHENRRHNEQLTVVPPSGIKEKKTRVVVILPVKLTET